MKHLRSLLAVAAAAIHVSTYAHAFLDHADPKVGSVVAAAPTELRLWFSQDVEAVFTTAEVLDAGGKRVDTGHPQIDPQQKALLHVPLRKLAPGEYMVNWRVVSVDTHPTVGQFSFRVGP
jgi:hypothetical protein